MAGNTYRQPQRQGPLPPPQQQYFNEQQFEERDYNSGHYNQVYDQRNERYQGYDDRHRNNQQRYQSYDDDHNSHEQWNDNRYQEPQHQEQYDQRAQYYDQGPRQPRPQPQQRSYQYDERYRVNSQGRPPVQYTQDQPPPRSPVGRLPPEHGPYGNTARPNPNQRPGAGGMPQTKVRERILGQQPESPINPSWDNPFPTFPSKKKQAEPQRADTNDPPKADLMNDRPLHDIPRPSTSHSSRQRGEHSGTEIPRPSTSHSQRGFEPLRTPLDAPPMPFRQDAHNIQPQPSVPRKPLANDSQVRPIPRRAMTGPAPSHSFEEYSQSGEHYPPHHRAGQPAYDEYPPENYPREQPQYDGRAPQPVPFDGDYRRPSQQRYTDNYNGHKPESRTHSDEQWNQHSTQTYTEEQGFLPHPPSQQQDLPNQIPYNDIPRNHRRRSSGQSYEKPQPLEIDDYDSGVYRGVPLMKKISPSMPGIDVLPENKDRKIEDQHGPSQPRPGLAYRKPTYESSNIQSGPQPQHYGDDGNGLASPLEQFTFGLDPSKSPVQSHIPVQSPATAAFGEETRQYSVPREQQSMEQEPVRQYPQRGVGRPQEILSKTPQGYGPSRPPPFRPGLSQPPPSITNHEQDYKDYNYDRPSYDAGPGRENGYNRPGLPLSHGSFHSEPSRPSHDQRIQQRPGFAPPLQVPQRPATSNSGRLGPPSDYGPRTSSDSFQSRGMQNPDSLPAHPAPFRPGLMQSTPPPPRPTPPPQLQQPQVHQRASSNPKPTPEPEAPVTIRELNSLREDYKRNGNDHALGLRFAKRLVEAAKVLSSENGRADPKQTAKNRERYILDAHKIVKRLCSSGYSEAMFYLADCHGQGLLGLAPDPKEAFSLYQSAAKLGHAQAAYRVAVCCELGAEEGGGTRRDPLKAVQWYKRAASLGDAPAMYKMGMIQLKGLLGQPKSPREAISWLKRAAERADAENPHALHELGLLYETAQSTDIIIKDEPYALQLFQQAAELGYKYSQFRLGSAYEYGMLGLTIDPRMSIAWYSRAARQGEHQAEFALSGWYLTGSGPPPPGEQTLLQQSDTEAYLWARKAASSGLAKAEYAMGYYTEVGIGVASNLEEAKRWYYRAAAQNHPKARERLEDLKKGGQRMQKTRVSRSNIGKHNEGECTVM